MKKFKLTKERMFILEKCATEKKTKKAAAAALGCTVSTLNKRLKEKGIEYPVHRMKPNDIECIRLNFGKEGVTTSAIAEKIGFTNGAVLDCAEKLGLYEKAKSGRTKPEIHHPAGYSLPGGYDSEAEGSVFLSYTARLWDMLKGTTFEKHFIDFVNACFAARNKDDNRVLVLRQTHELLMKRGVDMKMIKERIVFSKGVVI